MHHFRVALKAQSEELVVVTGFIDRSDGRQSEVPLVVGVQERGDKRTTGSINVDTNVPPILLVQPQQLGVQPGYIFESSVVRAAEDRDDTDGVLVNKLDDFCRLGYILIGCDSSETELNVKEFSKLFQRKVD